MRSILMAFMAFAALAASIESGHAQNRPFCTTRPIGAWGFPDCAYDTFEQCRATASGTGRYCMNNPWYVAPEKPKPVQRKKKRTSG